MLEAALHLVGHHDGRVVRIMVVGLKRFKVFQINILASPVVAGLLLAVKGGL